MKGVANMLRKHAAVFGVVLGLTAILVLPAMANILSGAGASADCNGFNLTVNATDLDANTTYEIDGLTTALLSPVTVRL